MAQVFINSNHSFIVVGFHADPNTLNLALAHFEFSMRLLSLRYPETDIVIFADLNIDYQM
jgi:hypothetical protein